MAVVSAVVVVVVFVPFVVVIGNGHVQVSLFLLVLL